jgi:large subunit ribosomal protein LX
LKAFRVKGEFKMGGRIEKFTKEILAPEKSDVLEYIYSDLGSKHRTRRRDIKIESVEEISPEDAENPVVRQLGGKR